MGKGSFNGLIRGKIGNSVFYKVTNSNNKEKQGIRQYIPTVANPRSNGQLYQRAIMATVMRAYAAGKEIFDHSFENVKTGGKSMDYFRKINVDALRQLITNEVSAGTAVANQLGRVVCPGVNKPAPGKFIISEGSLQQDLFTYNDGYSLPAAENAETVDAYAERVGLVPGDIYTLCAIGADSQSPIAQAVPNSGTKYESQFNSMFFFVRMTVKSGVLTDGAQLATMGQLFTIEKSDIHLDIDATTAIDTPLSITDISGGKYDCGSIGMIRSRENERLRSDCTMELENPTLFGIATEYILNAWTKSRTVISQSDLILEGGDF